MVHQAEDGSGVEERVQAVYGGATVNMERVEWGIEVRTTGEGFSIAAAALTLHCWWMKKLGGRRTRVSEWVVGGCISFML